MKVKEQLCAQSQRACQRLSDIGKEILHTPLLTAGISCAIWFFLGLMLSRVVVMKQCAPFGLGLVGAAGAGAGGLCALLGACLGSLSVLGLVSGLRCAATTILIYAAAFAFYDTRIYRAVWFMPLMSLIMECATGAIYLSQAKWLPQSVALFALEAALVVLSVWGFRLALVSPAGLGMDVETDFSVWILHPVPRRSGQVFALLAVMAVLTASLSQISLPGEISLGRLCALLAVLVTGGLGGAQAGTVLGVFFGLACDLAQFSAPYCTALFTLAGMASGFAGRKSRQLVVLCTVTSGVLISLAWQNGSALLPAESLAASLLYLLVPVRRLKARHRQPPAPVLPNLPAVPAMGQVQAHLEQQSEAFRNLYDHLRAQLNQGSTRDDSGLLFTRAANRVCRSCALRDKCWKQNYSFTSSALAKTLPILLERGRGVAADFDRGFTQQCAHFPAFLAASNLELSNLLARRQYEARVRENRAAVCRQYGALSQLLSSACAELSLQPECSESLSRRLDDQLHAQGVAARAVVSKDRRGHLLVELYGADLIAVDTDEFLNTAAQLVEVPLRRGSLNGSSTGQRLTLLQREPYSISAGVAAQPRKGNRVSGDACRWYKGEDGILRVILCDGMGSGADAAEESQLVIRLLEDLLQADVSPENALRTVNSAMGFRGELGGGSSTIDLLTVDLFSCEGSLYKLGAAPTYLCRGNQVSRVSGNTLPAGLEDGFTEPEVTRFSLAEEDVVLMVSDGVSDGTDDIWIRETLQNGRALSSKALALAVLQNSGHHGCGQDDRTAVALRLNRRV